MSQYFSAVAIFIFPSISPHTLFSRILIAVKDEKIEQAAEYVTFQRTQIDDLSAEVSHCKWKGINKQRSRGEERGDMFRLKKRKRKRKRKREKD